MRVVWKDEEPVDRLTHALSCNGKTVLCRFGGVEERDLRNERG
jgi:hypothetical protein